MIEKKMKIVVTLLKVDTNVSAALQMGLIFLYGEKFRNISLETIPEAKQFEISDLSLDGNMSKDFYKTEIERLLSMWLCSGYEIRFYEYDCVSGYAIKEITMRTSNVGFALGENPNAIDRFVVWRFYLENNEKDYHWGHYFTDEKKAKEEFQCRIVSE